MRTRKKNKDGQISHDEIQKKYHDQIVFDLKRGFLQFVTLILISKGPTYAYELKADILR